MRSVAMERSMWILAMTGTLSMEMVVRVLATDKPTLNVITLLHLLSHQPQSVILSATSPSKL
jgi:hypothetical protein